MATTKHSLLGTLCLIFSITFLFTLNSCQTESINTSTVSVEKADKGYSLMVNDQHYEIKGVGMNWADGTNFKALAESGGNTFRTWTTKHLEQELDSAVKYNLMIAVGLDMVKEWYGFDYNNEEKVQAQFDQIKEDVLNYKDHPNILCWVAGNELNLMLDENNQLMTVNPKAYKAIGDVVDFIHEVDPYHPVTSALAGVQKDHVEAILEHAPNLDFLSFQVYGALMVIPKLVSDSEYDGPFMITEFGPLGHWEMPSTKWGRPIEEPNAQKGSGLALRMERGITQDTSGNNIGSFAFEWGQKQERTPTWYGMFLKSGESSARIDELIKFWNGEYPENRCPLVDSLKLNDELAFSSLEVEPGDKLDAKVYFRNLDGDPLEFDWRMMKEVEVESKGGSFEDEPDEMEIDVISNEDDRLSFNAPASAGEYRLFIYIFDDRGKVGTANFPFLVRPENDNEQISLLN